MSNIMYKHFFCKKDKKKRHRIGSGIEIILKLMYLIPLLLLIPSIAAFEFDNVKSYDSKTKTLTFKDSLLGIPTTTIAVATLNTPQINYVIPGKDRLVAEFEIELYEDEYKEFLKSMEFVNLRNGRTINRNFIFKYKTVTERIIDDYDSVCKEKIESNGSVSRDCKIEKTGSKIIEEPSWTELTSKDLIKGKITLGIFTDVEVMDKVEWYPTLFGLKITEWATWVDGYNTNIQGFWKLNETVGTQFNSSVDSTGNMVLGNLHNATGIIAGCYPADASIRDNMGFPMNNGTLNFWIMRQASTAAGYAFITYTTGSEDGSFSLYVSGNNMDFYVYHDGSLPTIKNLAMAGYTSWHMITLVLNSTNEIIYIDGVLDTYHAGVRKTNFNDQIYFLGSPTDSSRLGGWNFDEIGLWNRILSPTEISNLYNSGLGITYIPTATAATPSINIVYPQNRSYNISVSQLNYTVGTNTSVMNCWYSLDGGQTNTSMICGQNITGLSSTEGTNIWRVWVNDTNGQNNDLEIFVTDLVKPIINLTHPTLSLDTYLNQFFGTTYNLSLGYNISDNKGLDTCWMEYWNYKNYSGINISIRMDYVVGFDDVYCYNFLTNSYVAMDSNINAEFVKFFVKDSCIDKSRINLKIGGGLNAFGEGTTKVYEVISNTTDYNLGIVHYNCENISINNVTGCGKAFDKNLATSADFQWALLGGTANIFVNYTLGNISTINCSKNSTNLSDLTFNNNYIVYVYANDSAGNIANNTKIFNITPYTYNHKANKQTIGEGDAVLFELFLNSTSIPISTDYAQSSAYLYFNGTAYVGTVDLSNTNYIRIYNNFIVPNTYGNLTGKTQAYYWIYNLTSTSGLKDRRTTDSKNVTIVDLTADNCTNLVGYNFVNFTIKDEETLAELVDTDTLKVEINISSKYNGSIVYTYLNTFVNYSTIQLCIPEILLTESNYTIDIIGEYSADNYMKEFYFLDNGTLSKTCSFNGHTSCRIDLLDLLSTDATSFLFNFKGADGLAVPDSIVHTYRRYVGEGVWREAQRGRQDDNGQTNLYLVEEDVLYYYMISLYGVPIFTSTETTAKCLSTTSICEISYDAVSGTTNFPIDWDGSDNTEYTISVNKTSRTVKITFNSEESSLINMSLYQLKTSGEVMINQSSLSAQSGIINLNVPLAYGNNTFYVRVYENNRLLNTYSFYLNPPNWETFGSLGLFIAVLIIVLIVFLAAADGVLVIILSVAALFMVGILGLVDLNKTALLFLVCIGGVLVWKISRAKR